MKIPFDIKFRPQIESGEYKVETRDGKPARILCWDKVDKCGQYIVALVQYTPEHENMISVCEDGIYKGTYGHGYDLFIITPEEELSEFELKVREILYSDKQEYSASDPESWKRASSELLNIARKELCEQIVDHTKEAYENGKAEALKDLPRWRKLGNGACLNRQGIPLAIVKRGMNGYELVNSLGIPGEQYIMLSDLEKLPGFND